MKSDDRAEFVKVLNGLSALKGKPLVPEALDLWWASMRKWTISDFKAAASHLVSACQFMPTPYDFEQLRRAGEATPAEAWTEALACCSQWRTPERLPTGRIGRAVAAAGGYRAIAMADIERDLPHYARRFKDAYEELSDVEETRESLPQIAVPRLQERNQRAELDDSLQHLLSTGKKTGQRTPTDVREE